MSAPSAVTPAVALPDPAREIRIRGLHSTRGSNYWSRRPVVRMDLTVGAYEHISSADVAGVTDALMHAMPGLIEHECSIGARGGFRTRLRRGTYAPHIIEHVALELQTMIGHDVGYGRTRGGDVDGEYTLVFEYFHELVGLRAAALALETVQRAFAGTLETVAPAVHELRALAGAPDTPPIDRRVLCGITGGAGRAEAHRELTNRLGAMGRRHELVVDVSPAYLLRAGLPYARSDMAIVLDARPGDVPDRYRDPERARRLMSVMADAVRRDGFVICPAKEWAVQDYAREEQCRVAVFAEDDDVTLRDVRVAALVARVRGGRVLIEQSDAPHDAGPLRGDLPAAPQVAAALAAHILHCTLARDDAGDD